MKTKAAQQHSCIDLTLGIFDTYKMYPYVYFRGLKVTFVITVVTLFAKLDGKNLQMLAKICSIPARCLFAIKDVSMENVNHPISVHVILAGEEEIVSIVSELQVANMDLAKNPLNVFAIMVGLGLNVNDVRILEKSLMSR